MANRISGPGIGLPVPANLYPAVLSNGAPFGENTNEVSLAAGETLPVPAGEWLVALGPYSCIQFLDPITNSWRTSVIGQAGQQAAPHYMRSDGFNVRVANLTGCLVGAIITGSSGDWTESTTTITSGAGNSTWQPIVGGACSTTVSVVSAGSGYGLPPLVFAPSPPLPGIPATFVAAISSGTVSGITCVNQGAGYGAGTVTLSIITDPSDPNLIAGSAISAASAVVPVLGGTSTTGTLTGAICTNPGAALSALPTLTVAGDGAGATLSPLWLSCVTSISITAGGVGYGTANLITSVGGKPGATPLWTNPATDLTGFIPRPLIASGTTTTTTLTATSTIDKGLFLTTQAGDAPAALVVGGLATTVATLALTLGSTSDSIILQQL